METKLSQFIQHAIQSQPISGTSLIISLYGDALHHRGGEVWLGSLTNLLEPMGFTDRFVRTSVFRLQKESWLDVEKIGRRSYYRISERGQNQFRHAESKIYQSEQPDWDGKWDLLLLEAANKEDKLRLKKELSWLGFGQFNSSLMAAPSCAQSDIPSLLSELNAAEHAIYFRADYPSARSEKNLKELVSNAWSLQEVAEHYHQFIMLFRPLALLLKDITDKQISPAQCFQLRLLLIHFYRRVILKDPLLPDELLPAQWEGQIARHLCTNIYQRVDQAATQYVSQICETTVGELPQPSTSYYRRFGGVLKEIAA